MVKLKKETKKCQTSGVSTGINFTQWPAFLLQERLVWKKDTLVLSYIDPFQKGGCLDFWKADVIYTKGKRGIQSLFGYDFPSIFDFMSGYFVPQSLLHSSSNNIFFSTFEIFSIFLKFKRI